MQRSRWRDSNPQLLQVRSPSAAPPRRVCAGRLGVESSAPARSECATPVRSSAPGGPSSREGMSLRVSLAADDIARFGTIWTVNSLVAARLSLTVNQRVAGSSPASGAISNPCKIKALRGFHFLPDDRRVVTRVVTGAVSMIEHRHRRATRRFRATAASGCRVGYLFARKAGVVALRRFAFY